jgi:flagellar biosynthesis/type III secretory pathway protein FliH
MNNINEMANKLLLFWHSEGDDLFDNASKALLQQQAEIEAAEQKVLDAFERGKMFGYAQGLRKAQEK